MARPFTEATGTMVRFSDSDDPHGMVHAEVQAGNVTTDVASVGQGAAMRLCDEGDVLPIDPATLAPGADGQPAAQDFWPGTLSDCFVPTDIYATVIAYRTGAGAAPQTAADFFDLERFPGRRGLGRTPQFTLELALLADGVPPTEVYQVLATPEGVERAFARLDTIKDQTIWWEAGAQPIQLLADGEVTMAYAFNGRIFNAAVGEGKPFKIIWDGQIYEMEGWVVPKGAPNKDNAMQYIAFTTESPQLAKAAEQISYGPPRKSAAGLVGNIAGKDQPMGPHLPTDPANLGKGLSSNLDFWVDHDGELSERFNAWLAG